MSRCLAILLLFGALTLAAQVPSGARIDINGAGAKVTYDNLSTLDGQGKVDIYGWDAENGLFCLYSDLPLTPNTWTQVGFSFTPFADCEVNLIMRGVFYKPDTAETNLPVYVYYDAIEATGAVIQNGDLEELDETGELKAWSKAEIVKDAKYVKSGKQSIRTWHNAPVSQKITVKANQPVTIKVWAYCPAQ
jgi:hypothetical protein